MANPPKQYLSSIFLVLLTALLSFFLIETMAYKAVALILLLVVSINAILFDIFPVMLSALISALIWNFFFIPPTFTFYIGTPEDALMFAMYFVVASINAVLTYKIREIEQKQRIEKEKVKSLNLYNTLFNSLSHELKTPIATIIGAVDTIKLNQIRLSNLQKETLHQEIEEAALRLDRQVCNLLNMSRLEAGFIQPKPDWIDLNEMIFKVINFVQQEAKEHKIVFQPQEDLPFFKLDFGLIEPIIYNILHNAILYTPTQSKVEINLQESTLGFILTIKDDGPGFPADQINHVFDKFYRLNHQAIAGTGLGLSIAKGFTEALNGSISLTNQPNAGACFEIEIPCQIAKNNHLEYE